MMDFIIKMLTQDGRPRFVIETDPKAITDDGILETAVIVSLFTDRQADADDEIPDGTGDVRGWWGDVLSPVDGDLIGSRLWLLHREKQVESVRKDAETYVYEALEHLLDDDTATSINVIATYPRPEWLALSISIQRADSTSLNFNYSWEAFNGI